MSEDSRETLLKRARELRPHVFIDAHEPAPPCTVEFYLDNARVVNAHGVPVTDWGEAREDNIEAYRPGYSLEYNGGHGPRLPPSLDEVPMYCYISRRDSGGHRFQYWMFYPKNPFCGSLGSHQSDWEHCSIYTTAEDVPERLYVSAHGVQECQWYDWADATLDQGHPVLVACKGSHAMHVLGDRRQSCCDACGFICFPRLCCCANDTVQIGSRKHLWNNDKVVLIDSDTPWVAYQGDWGYDRDKNKGHVQSLGRRQDWRGPENRFTSSSWLNPCFIVPLRAFMPCFFNADYSLKCGRGAVAANRGEL